MRRKAFLFAAVFTVTVLTGCAVIAPLSSLPSYDPCIAQIADIRAANPLNIGEDSRTTVLCDNPEVRGYFIMVGTRTPVRVNPASDEIIFVHNGRGTLVIDNGSNYPLGSFPAETGSIYVIAKGTRWEFKADERRFFDPVILFGAQAPPPPGSGKKPLPAVTQEKPAEKSKSNSGYAAPVASDTLQNISDDDPVLPGERVRENAIKHLSTASAYIVRLTDELRLRADDVFDELVFVHKGEGMMTLGDKTCPAKPGSVFFIPRRSEWKFIPLAPSTVEPVVLFKVFSPPYVKETPSEASGR
jgi:mannose-6-phosphate isomerase-like protein (cupin superfamily)